MLVPSRGQAGIHLLFGCLRGMTLRAELLIPLMFCFPADVRHAGFLILKDIEDFTFTKTRSTLLLGSAAYTSFCFAVCGVRARKPASDSNDLVLSGSVVTQPAKKMVPQPGQDEDRA